jgi:hypothetical protein
LISISPLWPRLTFIKSVTGRGGRSPIKVESTMTAQPKRSRPAGAPAGSEAKKHLDQLLDEALEQTFPASDPPAMLQPVPDGAPSERDEGK